MSVWKTTRKKEKDIGDVLGEAEVNFAVLGSVEEEGAVEAGLLDGLGADGVALLPCLLPVSVLVDLAGDPRVAAVFTRLRGLVDHVECREDADGYPEAGLHSKQRKAPG